MSDITLYRATLFMESAEDFSQDPDLIEQWLKRWTPSASLVKETEYTWEVEAPLAALAELPRRMFLDGEGNTYPFAQNGEVHPAWQNHFDDGKARPGFGGRRPNKSLERTGER